jgi:hypothetical protein
MTIDSRRLKCISHTPFISKSPIVTSLKPLLTNKLVNSILPTYLLFSIRISKTRPYLREGCCLFEVHGRTRLNPPVWLQSSTCCFASVLPSALLSRKLTGRPLEINVEWVNRVFCLQVLNWGYSNAFNGSFT